MYCIVSISYSALCLNAIIKYKDAHTSDACILHILSTVHVLHTAKILVLLLGRTSIKSETMKAMKKDKSSPFFFSWNFSVHTIWNTVSHNAVGEPAESISSRQWRHLYTF